MTATQNRNTYLEQVVAQQERLEQDLRVRRPLPEIVARLPKPDELRAVTIGGHAGTNVAELGAIVSALRSATE